MAAVLFEIQEMTAQDYDEVAGLWRNTEGIGLDDDTDTREGIAAYLARNPGFSYVARQQSRIVGAVLCGHDGRRGYLHHLAVDQAHRHEGVGRALVEACLAKLGSIGIQKCNILRL
jgi:ribosomal protein S18 acetylase RimI-like enzyme